KDAYVQQWSLTVEREIGFNTGIRLTYDGSHGSNLGYQYNADQVPANTVGFANLPVSAIPYPLLSNISTDGYGARSNYHSGTITVTRRLTNELQFQSSYTFAKTLSNAAGDNPTAFPGEAGGAVTDAYNLNLDYGNVAFTRRNRFQTTFLYAPQFRPHNAFVSQ